MVPPRSINQCRKVVAKCCKRDLRRQSRTKYAMRPWMQFATDISHSDRHRFQSCHGCLRTQPHATLCSSSLADLVRGWCLSIARLVPYQVPLGEMWWTLLMPIPWSMTVFCRCRAILEAGGSILQRFLFFGARDHAACMATYGNWLAALNSQGVQDQIWFLPVSWWFGMFGDFVERYLRSFGVFLHEFSWY